MASIAPVGRLEMDAVDFVWLVGGVRISIPHIHTSPATAIPPLCIYTQTHTLAHIARARAALRCPAATPAGSGPGSPGAARRPPRPLPPPPPRTCVCLGWWASFNELRRHPTFIIPSHTPHKAASQAHARTLPPPRPPPAAPRPCAPGPGPANDGDRCCCYCRPTAATGSQGTAAGWRPPPR